VSPLIVSYSRADEAFVRPLRDDLKRAGFTVWLDRDDMPSRMRGFRQEYVEASVDATRMLLVVSPASMRSPEVTFEWRSALEHCVVIVPALLAGDETQLPTELRKQSLNVVDVRPSRPYADTLTALVRILREPLIPPGPFLTDVPELPAHFLPRPDDLARVENALLAENRGPTVISSVRRTAALQGMGGVGKSVVAASFARLCETRRRYKDGVAWLRLGREADASRAVAGLARVLSPNIDAARALDQTELGALLANRHCLIVLDDVWTLAQVTPFRDALGPGGRLLVTTRDGGLTRALGAQEIALAVLDARQARALLADWAGTTVDALTPEALEVLEQCQRLPVAIAMAGAMVRGRPERWVSVLTRLRDADLVHIQQTFPDYPYPDLMHVIDVSVAALVDDVVGTPLAAADVRQRYAELAAFGEDTSVPVDAIALLWRPAGLGAADVEDLVDLLVDRSLLTRDAGGRMSLHDLQVDYAVGMVGGVAPVRSRLLDAYRAAGGGHWWSAPDHGYFHDRLGRYLVSAARVSELHDLLAAEVDGVPAWYELSEHEDRIEGYAADLRLAWTQADAEPESAARVGLQARYALILSSLVSTSANVPPTLLDALVRHGVWKVRRALAFARQVPDPAERVRALAVLVPRLAGDERERMLDEAIATLGMISDDDEREQVGAVEALAGALPEPKPQGRLQELLEGIERIPSASVQALVLDIIERHLSGPSLVDAQVIARRIDEPRFALRAQLVLAARRPAKERRAIHDEVLAEIRALAPHAWHAEILAMIAAHRPAADHDALLDEAEIIVGGSPRARAADGQVAFRVAIHATGIRRRRLLERAVMPGELEAPLTAAERLAGYAETLAVDERPTLLTGLRAITHRYSRIIGLAGMATRLPAEARTDIAREVLVEALQEQESRQSWDSLSAARLVGALAAVSGSLTPAEQGDIARQIRLLRGPAFQADAWVARARSLAPHERGPALVEALEALARIPEQREVTTRLAELAPLLTPDLLARAGDIAAEVREQGGRIHGMIRFLPFLPPAERAEAVSMALDVIEGYADASSDSVGHRQTQDLKALTAEPLSDELWTRALDVMLRVESPRHRADVLALAAARMPAGLRARASLEAHQAAQALTATRPLARIEEKLLLFPLFDEAARQVALQEIHDLLSGLDDAYDVARATVLALSWLSPAQSTAWLDEALEAARRDLKYEERAEALLVPHLTAAHLEALVEEYTDATDVEEPLVTAMVQRLAELDQGVAALGFLAENARGFKLLSGLRKVIPHLPASAIADADELIERVEHEPSRDELMASLCARLATLHETGEALARARALRTGRGDVATASSVTALAMVLPALSAAERAGVDAELASDLSTLEPSERSKLIRRLAPALAALQPSQLDEIWRRELERLSARPRTELLETLYALAPVLAALAGQPGVARVFRAVRQATAWWR